MSIVFATHARYLDHQTGHGHPERPARLEAVLLGARYGGVDDALVALEPRAATREEMERVHPAAYLDAITRFCAAGGGSIDADTTCSTASWEAASLAAGAGLASIEALDGGVGTAAFCAVRPPGHHATRSRAMGFCILNNVAVAAASLAARGERVLVVDYDAHHGNGTQDIFYGDGRVMYVSFHEWPLYPGTGALTETGAGEGLGTTVNFPLPAGATGDVYLQAIDAVLAPARGGLRPDVAGRLGGLRRPPARPHHRARPVGGRLRRHHPATPRVRAAGASAAHARGRLRPPGAGRLDGRGRWRRSRASSTTPRSPPRAVPGTRWSTRRATCGGKRGWCEPLASRPGGGRHPLRALMVPQRFEPVLAEVLPLAERFREAGHRLYLVGGVVRDLLLDREVSSDIDLTTDARPDQIKKLLQGWADHRWTQGEKFGTIGAKRGDRAYEITTHRAEAYTSDSRKPHVVFADDVAVDLSRRDFTVNAMALALPELQLIDPFDGAADLAAKRLRTPLTPDESFSDDPLRMMRAARFIAGYDLVPDAALVEAVVALRHRLEIVSAERIRDELDKLILVRASWRRAVVPGRHRPRRGVPPRAARHAARAGPDPPPQGRAGPHDRGGGERPARCPGGFDFRRTRLAALFHDVGKPKTRSYRKGKGVAFHHHEVVGGADDARAHAGAAVRQRRRGRRHQARRAPPAVPHLPHGLDRLGGAALRPRRGRPARRADRAHPLRLHDPQREEGPGPLPPHGRARGAHRRAGGRGGAARPASGPRRPTGDGAPRRRRRARRRRGAGLPARAAPRRGPARATTRPSAASTPGGRSAEARSRPRACERAGPAPPAPSPLPGPVRAARRRRSWLAATR